MAWPPEKPQVTPHHDESFPEVVGTDLPQTVPREEEGMQPVRRDWDKEHVPAVQNDVKTRAQGHAMEKRKSAFALSKRGWIIFGIVVGVIIALAVGLGAGLGVGLNSSDKRSSGSSSGNTAPDSQGTTSATSAITITTTTSSTTSAPVQTCSGVTSGTSGIACVQCNQTSPGDIGYEATAGSSTQQFVELCNIDMPKDSPVFNQTSQEASTTRNVVDLEAVIAYSFTSCMDQCAQYNNEFSSSSNPFPCKAVTYGANLTAAIVGQGSAGNCYLKDARGAGILDTSGLVMSGYLVIS